MKLSAEALFEYLNRKFTIRFNHFAFGMIPDGFHRVQPGAFRRQKHGQEPDTCLLALNLLIMLSYPGFDGPAFVPGSPIPDDHQDSFVFGLGDLEQGLQAQDGQVAVGLALGQV